MRKNIYPGRQLVVYHPVRSPVPAGKSPDMTLIYRHSENILKNAPCQRAGSLPKPTLPMKKDLMLLHDSVSMATGAVSHKTLCHGAGTAVRGA